MCVPRQRIVKRPGEHMNKDFVGIKLEGLGKISIPFLIKAITWILSADFSQRLRD